jgi:hypothetical protein
LGASPQEFESLILRQREQQRCSSAGLALVASRVEVQATCVADGFSRGCSTATWSAVSRHARVPRPPAASLSEPDIVLSRERDEIAGKMRVAQVTRFGHTPTLATQIPDGLTSHAH